MGQGEREPASRAPTWAGLIAVADQGRVSYGGKPLNGPNQTLPGLYSSIDYSNNFHDITEDFDGEGNNGFPTGPGYDLDTGIGSPRAPGLLPALAAYGLPQVVSSNPAQGQVVTSTPPTTFSLNFTEPIEPGSIVASDFTVNGTPANSAALSSDGLTITYTFSPSPVVTQGTETMELPAVSVIGALTGKENPTTFTASFLLRSNSAPGKSHESGGGVGHHVAITARYHRPGPAVQQGFRDLVHQHERL